MDFPVFSFKNLYRAYLQCRKNKRSKRKALEFELNAEENLLKLTEELQQRTYSPLPPTCFITESPKVREIFAADFRDRIVHHLLVSYLEPKWEPKFIHDSYACRKGKGTHAAVKRLQSFMRKVSNNRSAAAYFLQIDIKSFFVSINKNILFEIVSRKESNPDIIWLLKALIFHDPALAPEIKGRLSLFDLIPAHKSLFHTKNLTGLSIGNYTSQFFANVYLNEIDQFVKHKLHCRYYLRYVDDMILLSKNRLQLEEWEAGVRKYLQTRLDLDLNMKRRKLGPLTNGCNFLGYIIRPSHLLVRKRCVNNLKQKLYQCRKKMTGSLQGKEYVTCESADIIKLRAILAAYFGHYQHASSWKLINAFVTSSFLNKYIKYENNKLGFRTNSPRFANLYTQYRWFLRRHRNYVIFFQVGNFFEFYGRQRRIAIKMLNLRTGPTRLGLGRGVGFPATSLRRYLKKVLLRFDRVVVVRQTGEYAGRVMKRQVTIRF